MSSDYLMSFIIIGVILDTFWVAFFRRSRGGKLDINVTASNSFRIQSNFGIFKYSVEDKLLRYRKGKKLKKVLIADIQGLSYKADVKYALLEEWFFGFDVFDMFSKYQDSIEWYSISIVTSDQQEIPIFLAGQYQPREFLFGWYINIQSQFLERIGLVHNVGEQSLLYVEDLQECFVKHGIKNGLVTPLIMNK